MSVIYLINVLKITWYTFLQYLIALPFNCNNWLSFSQQFAKVLIAFWVPHRWVAFSPCQYWTCFTVNSETVLLALDSIFTRSLGFALGLICPFWTKTDFCHCLTCAILYVWQHLILKTLVHKSLTYSFTHCGDIFYRIFVTLTDLNKRNLAWFNFSKWENKLSYYSVYVHLWFQLDIWGKKMNAF